MAKLYGSVNGETKEINKLYGSVLTPIYEVTVTGIANNSGLNLTLFNNKWRNTYSVMRKQPTTLSVYSSGGETNVVLNFVDSSLKVLFAYNGSYMNQGAAWGFAQAPADGAVTSNGNITGYMDVSKRIKKLYGSVNGETKLIYEDTNA